MVKQNFFTENTMSIFVQNINSTYSVTLKTERLVSINFTDVKKWAHLNIRAKVYSEFNIMYKNRIPNQ